MSGFGGTQNGKTLPLENDGSIPTKLTDKTTEVVDSLFSQVQSSFTLAVATAASTATVLNYDFTAVAAHGLAPGDEIQLRDVVADRVFYAVVTVVVVNTITVDRPIDHAFPAPGLNEIISTEQAVNGAVIEQIFAFQGGTRPVDITRVLISIEDDTAMDPSTFGGIAALSRGWVFRIVNSYQKTIFNFKTNGDITQFCFDSAYEDRAGPGLFGFAARVTFAGQEKHGAALRISGSDQLQWIVQDDLTALTSLSVALQGHYID